MRRGSQLQWTRVQPSLVPPSGANFLVQQIVDTKPLFLSPEEGNLIQWYFLYRKCNHVLLPPPLFDLAKLKLQVSIMVVLLSAFQVASPSYSSLLLSGEAIIWNHRTRKYRSADWQHFQQQQQLRQLQIKDDLAMKINCRA